MFQAKRQNRHKMRPTHGLRQGRIGQDQGRRLGTRRGHQDRLDHRRHPPDRVAPRIGTRNRKTGGNLAHAQPTKDPAQMFDRNRTLHCARPLTKNLARRARMIAGPQEMQRIAQPPHPFAAPHMGRANLRRQKRKARPPERAGNLGSCGHQMQMRQCRARAKGGIL